jgi:hypothetical protein
MTIFEFIGQFFFQNYVFKLQEDFLQLKIRRTWQFPDITYFTDLIHTKDAKKIPKTVLKTRHKTKEITYNLMLPCGLFLKPLNKDIFSIFGRFIEYYLRNLTGWKKFLKEIRTQRNKIK